MARPIVGKARHKVANARIDITADYYPLKSSISVGALAVGEERIGFTDLTDSMVKVPPQPRVVRVRFAGTAAIVGANGSVVPDHNPANDKATTIYVHVNPGK